jgi:hypothetical protein
METILLEESVAAIEDDDRPSESFVRMVADLLETDANDILSELGYTYGRAVVDMVQRAERVVA